MTMTINLGLRLNLSTIIAVPDTEFHAPQSKFGL